MADLRNVLSPTGVFCVDRLERFANGLIPRDVAIHFSGAVLVGGADQEVPLPFAAVRQGVGLVDHDVLKTAVAKRVALFDRVEPADHALAAGARAEFDLLELYGERMRVVHLREKRVRADLGVVGFCHAKGMDALHRNTGALEKFGRVGMRGGHVGRKAVAFVEPVGLAELTDDGVAGVDFAEDQFPDLTDVLGECSAGGPITGGERVEIERERRGAAEPGEIKLVGREDPEFDGFGVGAQLGGR